MRQGRFTILGNRPLNRRYRLLTLGGGHGFLAPGQFAALTAPGFFLRRPFSVCDWDGDSFSLLFETVGQGTKALKSLPEGTELDALTGLGKGFELSAAGDAPLLIGGGSGVSPLYALAKRLLQSGVRPSVILGFPCREEVVLFEDFKALGLSPVVTTADGSMGIRGLVTDAMDLPHSFFYACGPEAMLRAAAEKSPADGECSFDARMGCGFGACMGCTRKTVNGPKRVCRDGPVFRKGEIVWED